MTTKLRYQLRPAKWVERQMIADALRRLSSSFKLEDYAYIGFGALEFIDFRVVHKALGISSMISIESDTYYAERYRFNRPFATVDIRFGRAAQVLPQLDWSGLKIVWLDYEKQLDQEVIRDCETVVRSVVPGSVLIVSINARATENGKRVATFVEKVGDDLDPGGLSEADLSMKGLPKQQRNILSGVVNKTARFRSGSVAVNQLFDFQYADDAPMQTLGWIVSAPNVAVAISNCRFDELAFIRQASTADEDSFHIQVPVLTAKESRYLMERLPLLDDQELTEDWLDVGEQANFASFYRWYPEVLTLA